MSLKYLRFLGHESASAVLVQLRQPSMGVSFPIVGVSFLLLYYSQAYTVE